MAHFDPNIMDFRHYLILQSFHIRNINPFLEVDNAIGRSPELLTLGAKKLHFQQKGILSLVHLDGVYQVGLKSQSRQSTGQYFQVKLKNLPL